MKTQEGGLADKADRLREACRWLMYVNHMETKKELAALLGCSLSSLSARMGGGEAITDKFVRRLCSMDTRLNYGWIMTGVGKMTSEHTRKETTTSEYIDIEELVGFLLKNGGDDLLCKVMHSKYSKLVANIISKLIQNGQV